MVLCGVWILKHIDWLGFFTDSMVGPGSVVLCYDFSLQWPWLSVTLHSGYEPGLQKGSLPHQSPMCSLPWDSDRPDAGRRRAQGGFNQRSSMPGTPRTGHSTWRKQQARVPTRTKGRYRRQAHATTSALRLAHGPGSLDRAPGTAADCAVPPTSGTLTHPNSGMISRYSSHTWIHIWIHR